MEFRFPSQPDPVFLEDELPLVARELNHGLRAASPQERVAFQLSRTGGTEGREETSGAVYLRGSLLYVTLTKFRSLDQVSYDSPEEGFDLSYEPADAVAQQQRESGRQGYRDQPDEEQSGRQLKRERAEPVRSLTPHRMQSSPACQAI